MNSMVALPAVEKTENKEKEITLKTKIRTIQMAKV